MYAVDRSANPALYRIAVSFGAGGREDQLGHGESRFRARSPGSENRVRTIVPVLANVAWRYSDLATSQIHMGVAVVSTMQSEADRE